MLGIHPYEAMIIKEKIDPAARQRIVPAQTEALRRSSAVARVARGIKGATAALFASSQQGEPCAAC